MFRKTGPIGASAPTANTAYDNIQGQNIMTDPRVISDVRRDFEDRGIFIEDDDELMRKWYDDQTYTNLNATVGPFNAYQRAEAATPESRARQARLRDAYQKLPLFYQGGGVGAGTAVPSMAKAIALDPLNLVGGFIGLGGKAVAKSAILATKAGKNPALAAAKTAASRSAMYEGALGGAFGGIYSVGQQNLDIKLGLQDQFSVGRLAGDIALEGAFSAGVGGAIGAAGGAIFQGGGARRAALAELEAEGAARATYSGDETQYIQDTRALADEAEQAGDEDLADALNAEADAEEAKVRKTKKVQAEAPTEDAPAAEAPAVEEPEPVKREGALTEAGQKLAEKEGVDISFDPETGVFADERVEAYVQARAAEKDAPVSNRLTQQDMRKILNVGATPEAKAARKLARDTKAVEDNGRPVTPEEKQANIEKIAEEQELDQDTLAKEAAIAEQEIVQSTIAARAETFENFTKTQRKRYDERVPELQKQFMEADPQLDEATALGRARGQAIDEISRGKTVSGRTGKRETTTGKATDAMRTAENAGRSQVISVDPETGRTTMVPAGLQKIFKGIVLPTRGSIARQEAIAMAEKTSDLVAFKAKSGQKAITGKGTVEMVSRGSAVVYDPESKKFFAGATEDEAMSAVRKFYENDELGYAAKREDDDAAVAEFIDKNGATQLDIGQTSKALQEQGMGAAKTVAPVREGLVLTIKWKSSAGDGPKPLIRQIRPNQISAGKSMHDLISGHTARSKAHHKNPENWEIFYAPLFDDVFPDQSRSITNFEKLLEGREPVKLSSAAAPAVVDGDASRFGAPAFDAIADDSLPAPETEAEEAMFEAFRQQGRQMDTYRNLLTRENEILSAATSQLGGDMASFLEASRTFFSYYDRVLPAGVKFPTSTRVAAREAIESMANRYPKSTIEMMMRILDGSRAEGAPVLRFVDQDAPEAGGVFYNPLDPVGDGSSFDPAGVVTRTTDTGEVIAEAAGVIEINPKSELHPAHILLHELAHWSMSYVMTPRMKLAFIEELATFTKPNGKIDMKALGLKGEYDAGANIKEIMANLFTKWASDKRFRAAFKQQKKTFFTKISEVFKKAFKFFMSGGVPEEFDPIFANLMADPDARLFRIDDFDNMPEDATAQATMRRNAQTTDVRRTVRNALSRDNYANAVEQTLSLLHGLSNSKLHNEFIGKITGQGAYGNNTGVFGPTAKFVGEMRDALRDLHRIADDVDGLSDQDLEDLGILRDSSEAGFSVTGGYNFDGAKTRELANLYEETVSPLLERIQNEMDVQFQMFALGQHPRLRIDNRKSAEVLKTGPQPKNIVARKQQQAEQAAQRAFDKTEPLTDEEKANQLAAADLLAKATKEELAQGMNSFALDTAPNRAAAQRIKRQLDAGTGNKTIEDQRTNELLEVEAKYNDLSIDGVAQNARPQVKMLQEEMSARTPIGTANTRELFLRLLNMLDLLEPNGTVKDGQLGPLVGKASQDDGIAMGSDTPNFKRLRGELRKIGQGLDNGTDVIPDVVVKVIRASGDVGADTIDGQPADQFMAMVVNELLTGRATPDDIFPTSPDRGALIDAANRYVDRVGYVVNGLISNDGLRKKYPGLMEYGHMMTRDVNKRPVTTVTSIGGASAPQVAADAFDEALTHGTLALRTNMVRFTRGAFNLFNDMPQALFVPVRRGQKVDNRGRPQTNGMFGMATYVSPDPVGALRTKAPDVLPQDGDDPFGQLRTSEALMELIADVDAQIMINKTARISLDGAEAAEATRDLSQLLRDREALLERLDQTGRSFDDVAPVITNAKYIADLSVQGEYQRVSPLTQTMAEAAFGDNKSQAAGWVGTFPDQFDGEDLYVATKSAIMAQGLSEKEAVTKIKTSLRKAGFQGVLGNIDDNGVNRPILALFDGDSVRSLQSPDMKIDVPDDSVPDRGIGTEFFELLASEKTLPPSMEAALQDHLIFGRNVSAPLASAASAMATGSRKTGNILKRGWDATMRGASGRFKQAGMNFLEERFDLFSTDHTRVLGKNLMPIIDRMNQLPGMPKSLLGKVGNYMTTAAQGNPNYGLFKEPKPMQVIRAALIDPRKAASLSPEQQQLYVDIRTLFQQQLKAMRAAGIQVGNLGSDYYPQVWNPQIIQRDPDGFKDLMKAYYQQEQPRATMAEAEGFADKIFNNITSNETGVIDFDADNAAAMVDSVTFGRLLRFQSAAPQLLDSAEKYMEQSLLATMVRYFDQTERAIQQANKLGVNGHMVGDYAKAVTEGRDGMIELLSTNKQFSISQRTVMAGGGVQKTNKVFNHSMLKKRDAVKAVDEALQRFNTGDTLGARQRLLSAYRGAGPAKKTYERRVDAIMGALQDFKGQPAALADYDRNAVEGYSRLIMRKRADGSTRAAQNVSRSLRMFQNITLLPYAAITSFSDLALPIIRSGDFKAAWNGWSRYLFDEQYRDTIRQIGVNMDGITHERMAQLIGDADNVIQSTFFKMTGLTPWTNINRAGSAAIGMEAMRHHMAAMQKMGPAAVGSPAYNLHARFLKSHGLTYDPSQPIPDFSTDQAYQRAVIRFVDNTIFSPKPQDMPLYANTPWGGLAYQLKSFSIMYGRFAKEMLVDDTREAFRAVAKGNFNTARKYMTRPTLLMTLGPAVAAGSLAAKDVVMSRGGEDSQSMALSQERRLSDLPFVKTDWADEDIDAMAGWYLTAFMTAGGLGLFGDLLHDAVQQSDNGAFGQQRMAEAVLGPTYGMIFGDLFNVGSAAMNVAKEAATGEGSAGVQRQGVREVVSRVPVLGGNRAFREGAVNLARQPEGKSSGVGGGPFKRTTYGTTDF